MQAVLDLLPQHRRSKCFFNNFIHSIPSIRAAQFGTIGDIVEDGHGKRDRKIKNHPDASPELGEVDFGIIDVHPIQENGSRVPGPKDQIRQTIQAFEERRLSAASWAEDGKDLFGWNIQIDILQSLKGSVIETEILDDDLTLLRHTAPLGSMPDIPTDQPLSNHVNDQDEQDQSRSRSVSHLHGDSLSGKDVKMDRHGTDRREEGGRHD